VFNILVIIAMSAAFARTTLLIDWRPLCRDVVFYLISIGLLLVFCWPMKDATGKGTTGHINWWESLLLILWYCCYILFMVFNSTCFKIFGCGGTEKAQVENNGAEMVAMGVTGDTSSSDSTTGVDLVSLGLAGFSEQAHRQRVRLRWRAAVIRALANPELAHGLPIPAETEDPDESQGKAKGMDGEFMLAGDRFRQTVRAAMLVNRLKKYDMCVDKQHQT
jgi:hypothetical protein